MWSSWCSCLRPWLLHSSWGGTALSCDAWSEIVHKLLSTSCCSSSGSCSAGKNLYAWLFDYTGVGVPSGSVGAPDCTQNGCNAGKNSDTYYWTSSSQYSDSDTAYVMVYFGSLSQTSITANTNIGIRPVIKISKDKLGIN